MSAILPSCFSMPTAAPPGSGTPIACVSWLNLTPPTSLCRPAVPESTCIAYLSLGVHPHWPLLIAANRDEYQERPGLAARPWPEAPHVIAGRDLSAGGTWLGLITHGIWALLSNDRVPAAQRTYV